MMNSDETVAYSGFLALWEALPLKTCENKTIRGVNSGYIQSPGYPDEESSWFEPPLDCWTFITAPGKSPPGAPAPPQALSSIIYPPGACPY